jgi:hypothetical protein
VSPWLAPLSVCIVTNVNTPGAPPSAGTLATAYVDVSYPNHPDG